jgi:hypothetical protein
VRTHEKIRAAVAELGAADLKTIAPDLAWIGEGASILRGLRILPADPIAFLLPDDPDDVDVVLDKAIALFLELRGDDLPPFDPTRYGEGVLAEFLAALRAQPEPS